MTHFHAKPYLLDTRPNPSTFDHYVFISSIFHEETYDETIMETKKISLKKIYIYFTHESCTSIIEKKIIFLLNIDFVYTTLTRKRMAQQNP